MLAFTILDFLFGILVGMWFAQTGLGKTLIESAKVKINEMSNNKAK